MTSTCLKCAKESDNPLFTCHCERGPLVTFALEYGEIKIRQVEDPIDPKRLMQHLMDAYNATHGLGINPKIIPDLFASANDLITALDDIDCLDMPATVSSAASNLSLLLTKATL